MSIYNVKMGKGTSGLGYEWWTDHGAGGGEQDTHYPFEGEGDGAAGGNGGCDGFGNGAGCSSVTKNGNCYVDGRSTGWDGLRMR